MLAESIVPNVIWPKHSNFPEDETHTASANICVWNVYLISLWWYEWERKGCQSPLVIPRTIYSLLASVLMRQTVRVQHQWIDERVQSKYAFEFFFLSFTLMFDTLCKLRRDTWCVNQSNAVASVRQTIKTRFFFFVSFIHFAQISCHKGNDEIENFRNVLHSQINKIQFRLWFIECRKSLWMEH